MHKVFKATLLITPLLLILVACTSTNNTILESNDTPPAVPYFDESFFTVYMEQTSISHDYFIFSDVEELVDSATDIFRGEVLSVRTEYRNVALPLEAILDSIEEELTDEVLMMWFPNYFGGGIEMIVIEPQYEVVTIHSVAVLEVFQGDYQPGDVVDVMQAGGTYGNMVVQNFDFVTLDISADLVFFVRSRSYIGRPAVLLNPYQSVYHMPIQIENVLEATAYELEIDLESAFDHNSISNFDITIEDLIDIYEGEISSQRSRQRRARRRR